MSSFWNCVLSNVGFAFLSCHLKASDDSTSLRSFGNLFQMIRPWYHIVHSFYLFHTSGLLDRSCFCSEEFFVSLLFQIETLISDVLYCDTLHALWSQVAFCRCIVMVTNLFY